MKSGQLIDATFAPVPIQRNTRDENAPLTDRQKESNWAKSKSAGEWSTSSGIWKFGKPAKS
jgi:hypothetical protein